MKRLVLIPVGVAVGAALLTLPIVLVNGELDRDTMFVPGADRWATILMFVACAAPLAHGVLLATIGRAALRALRQRWRWLYVIGTTLLQMGVAIAAFAAGVLSDPNWLGRGEQIASSHSNEAHATAYLTMGGFFCGYDVWVARDGERTMHHVHSVTAKCVDQTSAATIVWDGPSTVSITGPRGSIDSNIVVLPMR